MSSRAMAVTTCCLGLPRAARRRIAPMEALLRRPGVGHDVGRCAALSTVQRLAHERVMAVVPGGFHQDASEVGIAGLGDPAPGLLRATGVLGGDQAHEGHQARGGREAGRVAEFGGDGQGGQIIDAPKTAEPTGATSATARGRARRGGPPRRARRRATASSTVRRYA